MPQMMPMEWTLLYITFLMTFLMFNIMNYFTQPPTLQTTTKKSISIHKNIWKW
uniref:ATP synthase F0 subunit 8 n=1 Tax=Amalotermes phaeocephalus TaxID=201534 RepID=A0A0A7E9P4_9NEOP|nr:ATP synthase F0 subunit 8 [Amalotermes phaeocephalus]AIY61818.1 ATP synthase F0 subunit 8 [Amalotermes phaeocephalus]AQP28699.1 ATP synthase F0 subunit 8 [Amalotermes phaeocephalus]QXT44144.1 ATP synthase F0 subunit 8 [Amalotermes phaeocephalus]